MDALSIVVLFIGVFFASFVMFLGAVDFLSPISQARAGRFSPGRAIKRKEAGTGA
jgi:hypothetical protein